MRKPILTALLLSTGIMAGAPAYAGGPNGAGITCTHEGANCTVKAATVITPPTEIYAVAAGSPLSPTVPTTAVDTPAFVAPASTAPLSVPSADASASQAGAANPIFIAQAEIAPPAPMADTMAAKTPDAWGEILSTYGHKDSALNRFDYAGLAGNAADMQTLAAYINELAGKTPSTYGRSEALAYWANLYNALTVQVVAQNWKVDSIKEIKSGAFKAGPWSLNLVTVEGRKMSLNDIEHGTMRANYKEPRIHYMVNCASIGCPNLMLKPWHADRLEADMDAAAKAFINAERGADVSGGKLTVSSIFKWYKKDFGGNDAGIIAHLKQYADADLRTALNGVKKISKDQYNWNVNAK